VPLRAHIVTVVLFAITLATPDAAAQDDPSPTIDTSILSLAHPDPKAREAAPRALGRIGPAAAPAVPALADALTDPDQAVRLSAASALGWIGPAAAPAVPALIEVLADPDQRVRGIASGALGLIGPPAVPALANALADPDQQVRAYAALALREIGPAAAPAVPALADALTDPDKGVRASAALALQMMGPAAAPAMPALADVLADRDQDLARIAAAALAGIATSLQDATAVTALGALRETQEPLETHIDPEIREHAAAVRRAVQYLELQSWEELRKNILSWIYAHYLNVFVIGAVLLWLAFCLASFWLHPAILLMVNNVLRPFHFKLPDWLGGMTVSLRHLLLVGVLNHRPRVLDAWVSSHVGKARKNFERKRTVEEREVHVPVPVHLNKTTIPELMGGHLRGVFGAGTGRLLIWGEGGSGKTSIACRIARWAMADAPEQRPAPHRMLPVLIERELDFEVASGRDPFTETVRGDLEKLIEAQVGDDLLRALLGRRRVLVIVDHLSEMTEKTRQRVRPDVPDFPAAALVVTSRLEERLGDVPKSSLRPLRVTGDCLFEFMGAYLKTNRVRELFPDREFGQAGARIVELVGERAVTVLLVKLYLDRLIATKERSGDIDKEMPGSIPSLMLQYLNDINRAVPEGVRRGERAVHRDAETLAWVCLEERFRPASALMDETAMPALAAVDPSEVGERLDYLERRLRLIETAEPERDRVRFTLDPVAEYLAGLHIVERYGAEAWWGFLDRADAMPGGLEAVRGFLLAVRDCCLAKEGEVTVPEFVTDELAARAGLDLERLRQARLRERVAHYAERLRARDPSDRRLAAEALGEIGPAAAPAVAALTKALTDADPKVRELSAHALGQIAPAAEPAMAALIKVLADPEPELRRRAAHALGEIGPAAAPAVAALTKALTDADPWVRRLAAQVLGGIGPAAAPAVAALTRALVDPEPGVGSSAAGALRRIGPAAKSGAP
jgi:HEAT repeat protein